MEERIRLPVIRFTEDLLVRAAEVGLARQFEGRGSTSRSGLPPSDRHHIIGAMGELAFGTWFPLDPPIREDLTRAAYDHALPDGSTVQVKSTTAYPPRLAVWTNEPLVARYWVLVHVFANDQGPDRPVPFHVSRDWRARIMGWIEADALATVLEEIQEEPDRRSKRVHRNYLKAPEALREIAGHQGRLL